MSLLDRLGGRKSVDLRPQSEILQKPQAEPQSSQIKSAFEEKQPPKKLETFTGYRPTGTSESKYQQLKLKVHRQIVTEMSADEQESLTDSNRTREEIQEIVAGYCHKAFDEQASVFSRGERLQIIADICDEILGLGPIEPLLKDPTISEVMINGASKVFVEQKGKLYRTDVKFHDETHLMNIIEKILSPLGRRVDESVPMVDARLADGSRVNIIIPPLALDGAMVTIRKFSKSALSVRDLIGFGTLDERMATFLEASVKARLNILVSGGTGSGKTTTLNTLSSFIPPDDRIVTIEDAAELKLQQDHVVRLESRPANTEGEGAIAIRDLVRNALRMRPDRIIVGEVRSGEALDMLQAMNTGHDGSLTTAHANTPRDALSRLETMVLMAGMELPVRAIRTQISSAIDLILQQSRIRDGSRKITHISEVQGMEGDTIIVQDLFQYVQDYIDERGKSVGHFEALGLQPAFMDKFKVNGVDLPLSIFEADRLGGRR